MKPKPEKEKLNSIVSMYKEPALGEEVGKNPVMALSVDKTPDKQGFYYGIARIITDRKGSPDIPGFVDKSKLIIVKSLGLIKWEEYSDLKINGIEEVIKSLSQEDRYFIGLEDPDILREKEEVHVYFTIAFKMKEYGHQVYLGHAQGKTLQDLKATPPLLGPMLDKGIKGFKESTIHGNFALNEVLKKLKAGDSSITLSKINDLGKPFEFQRVILNPEEMKNSWCQGELSPCTIFPKEFVHYGNLLVGIVNGREERSVIRGNSVLGKFRPGLILFNPETGEIPWIDDACLLEDPKATTITFASDFLVNPGDKKKGILYAHPNDSFVRAYEINAKELKKYLDKKVDLD